MTKCIFCPKIIPIERIDKFHKKVRYCSTECIKRASYVRTHKFKSSSYIPSSESEWVNTGTGKGRIWEIFVANLTKGELQPYGSHFDILIDGKRIDVKSCNLYKRKNKRGKAIKNPEKQIGWWVFNRNSGEIEVDSFICIGLIDNKPIKIYKIPSRQFRNGIVISPRKSKFDEFIITL